MNRIDDRLIHGQVIIGWTKLRNVNSILIVDDGVAKNQMMLDIFRFAAPTGVKLEAVTVELAAERLKNLEAGNDRLMLLAKVPATFLRLLELGYKPADINYGAMAHKAGSKNVAQNCELTQQEIEETEKMYQAGIRIWIQLVPFGGQKEIEWASVRAKLGYQ
jgi:mannose/fructose/N-acetylgalactosamine-specific phosphotransferase system component IIB